MNWQPDFLKHLERRSKLSHLAALTAVEDLQAKAEESQKNNAAESAAVRRSLWGEEVTGKQSDDEMRTTILGDVTHPAPVVISQPQQPQSLLPMVALALAASMPLTGAAGVIGYLLANRTQQAAPLAPAAPTQDYRDSTVKIGLGRIEDLVKDDANR